ncbi:MAG: leucine-rich repeat protein [Treponema sp.]|nr:leucine-rich repeat protein [Treponema sp.]
MKKLTALFSVLVLLGAAAFARPAKAKGAKASADGAAPADNGKVSIAVPAPKAVNLEGGADWIPLFIQGIITTNFQQYSGLAVIDRQNADMVKAEQRLSEGAEFDEKTAIELGKMTSAKLIITGSIMAKSGAYALTFSITDAESGETKATANVPNCLRSALEDGTAANQISYDLMAGYGIALGDDAKARLTQTASAMAAEMSAQTSVAKGIAAAKGGSNIEALTYYIQAKKSDRNLSEATSRMADMATVVAGGNFGANAKNLIKVRKDWDQLLLEAAGLIAANPPEFEVRYFTDIAPLALREKDYANKTMSFLLGAPYLLQTSGVENAKIAAELMDAMRKIPESKIWGDKMNGFPWTYADDIPGDHWLKWANEDEYKDPWYERQRRANPRKYKEYQFTVMLLDANKKTIAKKPYTLYVKSDKRYAGFKISSDNKDEKNNTLPFLIISDVPVGNADTDKIYISVENAGSQKISVLPTDAMPVYKALKVLEAGSHNGTVKIGGFEPYSEPHNAYNEYAILRALTLTEKPVALDLSEMINFGIEKSLTFKDCKSLKSITLPEGITGIGGGSLIMGFEGCTSLESVTIPAGVTTIGGGAFSGCTALKSITIPDGVTTIGSDAFRGCWSLASVTIPAGVTTIGVGAFRGCASLKSITIPDGVTEIGDSAFSGCTSLETITIPEGVTVIYGNMLADCSSLESIAIPVSVTSFRKRAFINIRIKDPKIYYAGSKDQWEEIDGYLEAMFSKKVYNYNPQEAESLSDGKKKNKKKK